MYKDDLCLKMTVADREHNINRGETWGNRARPDVGRLAWIAEATSSPAPFPQRLLRSLMISLPNIVAKPSDYTKIILIMVFCDAPYGLEDFSSCSHYTYPRLSDTHWIFPPWSIGYPYMFPGFSEVLCIS